MKLRNKKTRDIANACYFASSDGCLILQDVNDPDKLIAKYASLAELNKEWEDYEEPKTFWYITAWGDVYEYSQSQFAIKQKQAIGNYFETKEEAEKAVERLKKLQNLKNRGYKIDEYIDMIIERGEE